MDTLNWIYSLCCGFGIAFLLIQFLFSFGDSTDHSPDSSSHEGHDALSHDGQDASSAHAESHDGNADHSAHGHQQQHSGSELHSDDLRNLASQVVQKTDVSIVFLSLLAFLRVTRKLTYFCAGFGTMGLLCNLKHVPLTEGLIASVVVGVVSMMATSFLFKLVNPSGAKAKDSRISNADLVGLHAEVISKIGPELIGEIKICFQNQMVQVYALPNNGNSLFPIGETVLIYQFDPNGKALVEAITNETGGKK
jgi:hypothetical protein